MNVFIIREWAYFHTEFDEKYTITNTFTNVIGESLMRNGQFDFLSTGIRLTDNPQGIPGIVLSESSDAVPAFTINGAFIGGCHGQPCCINVYSPNHNKTLADVGSVYVDDENVKFTIVRVINDDYITVISENLGESECEYNFKLKVDGKLKYLSNGENTDDIEVLEQIERVFLSRAIKHKYRDVVVYSNGIPKRVISGSHKCDYAELQESYDIINPATVAPALTAERPEGGYKYEPNLADFGKPMLNLTQVFRIMPDGTVIVEFEVTKLMPVNHNGYLGVMYQEMKNAFGGGIFRTLPKIKPFTTEEGDFDFSTPQPLRGASYPKNFQPTEEYDLIEGSPFDRIVDYFRDNDGNDKLGFACGYLPVEDGHPSIRKNFLTRRIFLYHTRKAYPWFASTDTDHYKGVAYKKFFNTEQRASVYAVEHKGKKYIYFDIFEKNTLTFKANGKVTLHEVYGLDYKVENGLITVRGDKGFAVFIEE